MIPWGSVRRIREALTNAEIASPFHATITCLNRHVIPPKLAGAHMVYTINEHLT